jgi:lipopolysaccharide export system protein LptC
VPVDRDPEECYVSAVLRTRTAALLALVVSSVAAAGCRPAKPAEGQGLVPELKLDGVHFRVYRDDALAAFGEAAAVSFRRDSTDLAARDVETTLPRGPAPVRIEAPAASGVASARAFEANGGIAVSRGADVARTERARYAPAPGGGSGLVTGDRPVVVEGKGYRLEGAGFTLDPARGEIAVSGGARLVAGARGVR